MRDILRLRRLAIPYSSTLLPPLRNFFLHCSVLISILHLAFPLFLRHLYTCDTFCVISCACAGLDCVTLKGGFAPFSLF